MGDLWLVHLAKWHQDAGLDYVEFNEGRTGNWKTLSRSSGGYDDILAIQDHHDASAIGRSGRSAALAHFKTHEFAPVGAIATDRDGVNWIGAAGATNTSGLGGPLKCSRGTIPKDAANRFVISRESGNNGVGETWSPRQLESIAASDACIIRGLANDGAYNARTRQFEQIILDPLHLGDVHAHFEWAPTRKIDPAGGRGQFPYGVQSDRYMRWDMPTYRADVAAALNPEPPEDDDMQILDKPYRSWDSREHGAPLAAGQTVTVPVGLCARADIVIGSIGLGGAGYLYVNGADNTSAVGYSAASPVQRTGIPVVTPDGHITVTAVVSAAHFTIDVYAVA